MLWLVAAALLAACGVSTDDEPSLASDADVPFGLLERTPTNSIPPAASDPGLTRQVQVCFVGRDDVVPVPRQVRQEATPWDLVTVAAAGPDEGESRQGLSSSLAGETLVRSAVVGGGVARVDLAPAFADAPGHQQLMALAQLVCTLTAQPGIGQVAFSLAGEPVQVPLGDGSLRWGPVSRDDYAVLIRPPKQ